MKRNFPNKRIIIPEEAGLSVLKGAVLFGHKPDYIASLVVNGIVMFTLAVVSVSILRLIISNSRSKSKYADGSFCLTINNIVSLVKDVLRKPAVKNVPLLLLVGGFGECPLVQAALKRNFPNKRNPWLFDLRQWYNNYD
jgi:hypothetical protein